MKRFTVILLLSLISLLSVPLFAEDLSVASFENQDDLHQKIRVGYYHIDGWQMMDENGVRSGYAYEYLQSLRIYNNWHYEYLGYNKESDEMQGMLERGEIDLLATVVRTPEMEERFDLSSARISTISSALVIKDTADSPYIQDNYETYNHMVVGIVSGSEKEQHFVEFAKQHCFDYSLRYFATMPDCIDALHRGNVNAIITTNRRTIPRTRCLNTFNVADVCIAVKKGNIALLKQVDDALRKLEFYHPDIQLSLMNKCYVSRKRSEISFSAQEYNFIKKSREQNTVFTVAVSTNCFPYAYIENGTHKGILIDTAAEILKRTGLQFSFVSSDDFESIEIDRPSLLLTEVFDYFVTETADYTMLFPYYKVEMSRVLRNDFSGVPVKVAMLKVGILKPGSYFVQSDDLTIVEYDTAKECATAVLNKTCDAAYLPVRTARNLVFEDTTNQLSDAILVTRYFPISIAVDSRLDSCLSSIIDKAMYSISDSDLRTFATKYIEPKEQPITFWRLQQERPFFMFAVVLSISILVILLVFSVLERIHRNELAIANEHLQSALVEARSANDAKSEFLSRMSHDIRTPLNGIIGMTNLAESEENIEELKRDLQAINISGQFLMGLINDILDFSRIESGRLELHYEPYTYAEFLEYIRSVVLPLFSEKNIHFTIPQTFKYHTVIVDKLRLNQILFNLLSNAAKFTPENGFVALFISGDPTDNNYLSLDFTVKDSGVGMSSDFLKVLFEPFTQEWKASDQRQGSGLGLSIVKSLTELMGGTISVKSEPQKGTEITIHFEKLKYLLERRKETVACEAVDMQLAGLRVLLVEDHPMNVLVASKLLKKQGMIIEVAENGYIGVEKFKASDINYYNVILMDIRMPVMDGLEATRHIRDLERVDAQTIPIIAMTADVFDTDIQKSFDVGINKHLGKPIVPGLLYDAIRTLVYPPPVPKEIT